jgi:hypothetical protein
MVYLLKLCRAISGIKALRSAQYNANSQQARYEQYQVFGHGCTKSENICGFFRGISGK